MPVELFLRIVVPIFKGMVILGISVVMKLLEHGMKVVESMFYKQLNDLMKCNSALCLRVVN